VSNECWTNSQMWCLKSCLMNSPRVDELTMQLRWCWEWHLPPRPHIEWVISQRKLPIWWVLLNVLNECWMNFRMWCFRSYLMNYSQEDKLTMQSRWCRKWYRPSKPHIEWTMKSWNNLRINLKNYLQRVTSNLTSDHMGHLSSLFTKRM
jgi:hypothetical protein